jgi:hypothetical protein
MYEPKSLMRIFKKTLYFVGDCAESVQLFWRENFVFLENKIRRQTKWVHLVWKYKIGESVDVALFWTIYLRILIAAKKQ